MSIAIGINVMQAGPEVIGSTLLSVMDRLALEVIPEVGNFSTENIGEYRILNEGYRKAVWHNSIVLIAKAYRYNWVV